MQVYLARWRRHTLVAAKFVFEPSTQPHFWQEVQVLQNLRHPNIVTFLGASLQPGKVWKGPERYGFLVWGLGGGGGGGKVSMARFWFQVLGSVNTCNQNFKGMDMQATLTQCLNQTHARVAAWKRGRASPQAK
jgi:serine/threonine protein kinase